MFTKVRRPEFGIQRWWSGKQGCFPHLMSCSVCEHGRGTVDVVGNSRDSSPQMSAALMQVIL